MVRTNIAAYSYALAARLPGCSLPAADALARPPARPPRCCRLPAVGRFWAALRCLGIAGRSRLRRCWPISLEMRATPPGRCSWWCCWALADRDDSRALACASLFAAADAYLVSLGASDARHWNPLGALAVLPVGRASCQACGHAAGRAAVPQQDGRRTAGRSSSPASASAACSPTTSTCTATRCCSASSTDIWTARGVINALTVPLIAVSVIGAQALGARARGVAPRDVPFGRAVRRRPSTCWRWARPATTCAISAAAGAR
jgi:hypothetical protein